MARKKEDDLPPAIRRARYRHLVLYEISEGELEQLERGSPDSILLNFSVFFLSTFLSFLTTLITASFESVRVFLIFVVVAAVSCSVGTVLLVLWWHSRRNVSSLVRTIRDRLPPEPGTREVTEVVDLASSRDDGGLPPPSV